MAGQSLAMGEAFGKGFQYGKRKISSMSNEEFNALDFKELSESLATDYRVMIPSLTKSIEDSQVLQQSVFKALGQIITSIPEHAKDFLAQLFPQDSTPEVSTTSTVAHLELANQLGQIQQIRFTPSQDRAGDKAITDAALAAAQKAFDDAIKFGSTTGLFSQNEKDKEQREKDKRKLAELEVARLEKIRTDELARQRTAEEARLKTEQIAFEKVANPPYL